MISARNCTEVCSATFVSLFTERSTLWRFGPIMTLGISECTWARLRKCRFVEPFVRSPEPRVRVADEIGPVVQFARATGVHAQEGCDRQTALSSVNATQLPA